MDILAFYSLSLLFLYYLLHCRLSISFYVLMIEMSLYQIYSGVEVFFRRIQMSKDLDGFSPGVYCVLNRLWMIQTLICILHCIKVKRYLPRESNSRHVAIFQFNFVLLTYTILYAAEIVYTHLIILRFNSFIHHVIGIIIFIWTIFHQNMICVIYLIPYVVHSLYWCFETQYDYLLYVYNGSLIGVILLIICFSCSTQNVKLQVAVIVLCLFHFNVLTHFYEHDLNVFDTAKTFQLMKALCFSFFLATPFYFYLLYISLHKRTLIVNDVF